MKEKKFEQKNTISRRETIALLASAGALSLTGLSSFEASTSTPARLKNMTTSTNNNEPVMKTIGILGGLGPQATMDLEKRIHEVSQRLIDPAENSGYPPMVVQYYRHPPVLLTADRAPIIPFQPDPRLLEVAKTLGTLADFLLIASNGIHLFQKEIEQASGRKVISMIDATLEEVRKKGWQKTGVLGLMNSNIYTTRPIDTGIAFETIDNTLQEKLNLAIFRVMEGREDETDRAVAMEAITQLRNKKVDGIIPGCTEIPFLLGENMRASDLLNPVQLLAEATVRFCLA
jgi:aspartate racemase